jgi:hypothetical protein
MAQSEIYAVHHTPDLRFVPWKFDEIEFRHQRLPTANELTLWRFRAEWGSASRASFPFHISRDEQNRAARSPSSAIAKRYLVSRAVLRNILSVMLDCPPAQIDLDDDAHAQPQLIAPAPRQKLCIRMAYAGIWVLLGMSGQDFGMSVALPDVRPVTLDDDAIQKRTRDQSRRDSVLSLAGVDAFTSSTLDFELMGNPALQASCDASSAHIVEVPMPGQICAAVATHEPLRAIDAVGWRSYEQIA